MLQKRRAATLLGLCAALSACDAAPTRDLTAPDPEAGTLDAQSVSLFAPSNTWAAKRPIPSPRFNHKAATLDSIIYVVGGYGSTCCVPLSRVDAYNVANNLWSPRRPLPSARSTPNGASVINGRIYVTGGRNSSSALTKTLFVYDPGTDTWTRKANMPQAGACGAQGATANLLYVYNTGCGIPGAYHFYRYNPATNTWITLAPPPSEHEFGSGDVIGGKFYLVGGTANSQLDVYNPATNTWTTRGRQLEVESFMASAVLNGKLFLAGGFFADDDGNHTLATLRVYSPGTNTWTKKAPLPTPRDAAAGAAAGGQFFVIAGRENNVTTRKVVAYTP